MTEQQMRGMKLFADIGCVACRAGPALTYPYMNNGETATLDEAIRIMGEEMPGQDFTDDEVADIEAFMQALPGEMPQFEIPALP